MLKICLKCLYRLLFLLLVSEIFLCLFHVIVNCYFDKGVVGGFLLLRTGSPQNRKLSGHMVY